MKRVIQEELMDADLGTPQEIAGALRSIRHVNQRFGGARNHRLLLLRAAERVPPRAPDPVQPREIHILEVAAGHADVLQSAAHALIRRGMTPRLTLLDRSAQHLPTAADWDSALPEPARVIGDALHIPLPDASVDVVACCLFLHHLDEPQAAQFLREALRVARVAVVINDLERTAVHYALARLRSLVDGSRISRHDGPVSVRRAYTRAELDRLLRATGHPFELRRRFLFRLGAVLWK